MARKAPEIDLEKCLEERFERWDSLKNEGGSDPFWADGSNMNLVRAHIKYYKKEIEKNYNAADYPEIYYRETPPETDNNYIAQPDRIRENAKNTQEMFRNDPNLKYLKSKYIALDEKFAKQISVSAVMGYENSLDIAIANDDLIAMRRFANADMYIKSFQNCADKIRAYKPPENAQISMFDMDDEDEIFEITM